MPKTSQIDPIELRTLIERGRGVVRRTDLRCLGMSPSAIAHRTRPGGPWRRLLPGVVLTTNGPPTLLQRIRAAVLYAGPGAVVTGVAALRLHGVDGLETVDVTVRVLVPHRRQCSSREFVVIERTRRLPRPIWRRGIPCAPAARSVIDEVRHIHHVDAIRAVVATTVQQRRCRTRDLAAELRAAGRPGTRLPKLVLAEVVAGVRSVAEAKVREAIRAAGLPEPMWNHDIYDAQGSWLGRPDAVWVSLGVVLEIDSMAWHLSPALYRRTQARQRRLTRAGLLVVPVAPADVYDNPHAFVAELAQTLAAARERIPPTIRAVRSEAA